MKVYDKNGSLKIVDGARGVDGRPLRVFHAALEHDSAAVVPLFTLPVGATVHRIVVIVDETFDGMVATMSVGVNGGDDDKYLATDQVWLIDAAETVFDSDLNMEPNIYDEEDLEIAYDDAGSTAGKARIQVYYSTPG